MDPGFSPHWFGDIWSVSPYGSLYGSLGCENMHLTPSARLLAHQGFFGLRFTRWQAGAHPPRFGRVILPTSATWSQRGVELSHARENLIFSNYMPTASKSPPMCAWNLEKVTCGIESTPSDAADSKIHIETFEVVPMVVRLGARGQWCNQEASAPVLSEKGWLDNARLFCLRCIASCKGQKICDARLYHLIHLLKNPKLGVVITPSEMLRIEISANRKKCSTVFPK